MDRLTKLENDRLLIKYINHSGAAEWVDWWASNVETIQGALMRLLSFESTGLTPEQVAAMQAELASFRAGVESGQLVRFPEFPQDMNDLLEPLKVTSAINSEMRKLEFRKEHRPQDVSILDYTIIAALHKVLTDAADSLQED